MSKTQIYPLTKRPQLIDLNGENVNFKLDFQVKAINPEHEFQAIVLTQEQLDSTDINKIEMKQAKGVISGNIVANNNKYQNYFLVLKKTDNTPEFNVQVDIVLEPVEAVIEKPVEFTPAPQNGEKVGIIEQAPLEQSAPLPFYKKPWFAVFVILVALCVGFFLYNYVYLKKPFLYWNQPAVAGAPLAAAAAPVVVGGATAAPAAKKQVVQQQAPVVVNQSEVEPIATLPETISNPVETNLYQKLQEIA
jgi:hypothetical protein